MTLAEACMQGLQLNMPDGGVVLVDFVVVGEDQTFVFVTGWWNVDWTEDGIISFGYEAEQAGDAAWIIEGPPGVARLTTALADGDSRRIMDEARRWIDVHRGEYMIALARLREGFIEVDFSEWVALLLARPEIDAVEEIKKSNLGSRKIGGILLLNQDNERVDALAVDEQGNAATANGTAWLSRFVDDWAERDDRPSIEDYMRWIAEVRPYGPYTFGKALVGALEGHIEDIAISLFRTD